MSKKYKDFNKGWGRDIWHASWISLALSTAKAIDDGCPGLEFSFGQSASYNPELKVYKNGWHVISVSFEAYGRVDTTPPAQGFYLKQGKRSFKCNTPEDVLNLCLPILRQATV